MKISSLLIKLTVLAAFTGAAAGTSIAGTFPDRQVSIVAAFPPGGTVDKLARVLGQQLSEDWNQPVIVENRPGASGIVGSQHVLKATPDGYTLMVIPITHVTNASLFKLPFDPLNDFTPISLLASQPLMLVVNPDLPIKSVADVIETAKVKPGSLNCGSGGNGTSQHLACELFKSMTGAKIVHVPYKGNAAAMTDVIGGQIQLLFDQMATAVPHVTAGKVKALGVSTAERSKAMPEIPTIAEAGVPGYEATAWFGVVGPAGMPADVVEKIQRDFAQAIRQPKIQENLSSLGLTLIAGSPSEFKTLLGSELSKWAKVIQESGAKLD